MVFDAQTRVARGLTKEALLRDSETAHSTTVGDELLSSEEIEIDRNVCYLKMWFVV